MLKQFPVRLFGYYFGVLLRYNAVFSVCFFLLTAFNFRVLVYAFGSMGFVVAQLLYYLWRNPEYYFYFNRGLSKRAIMTGSFLLNLVIALLLRLCFQKLGLW